MYEDLIAKLRDHNACIGIKTLDEAADVIEELSKPRWIPVTERLPNAKTPVIVTDGVDVGEGMLFKSWWYSPADIDTEHITHWQPLPEPPKEET